MESALVDDFKFKQIVYDSSICIYRKNGKSVNPLKHIESMEDDECNEVLLRIFPNINLDKIKSIFDELPEEYNGLTIMSETQEEFYFKTLEYRYNNVLLPIYNRLLSR